MAENFPYKKFGMKLKSLRELASETLSEVAGAVEIDSDRLEKLENGIERPSEDIVLLLINHFELQENEADHFWELAGYNPELADELGYNADDSVSSPKMASQPAIMIMPLDARVVYSDMVNVSVNEYGVIMNFMQGAGQKMQPIAIARVGMSKEHARSVIKVLQETLEQHDKAKQRKELNPPSEN